MSCPVRPSHLHNSPEQSRDRRIAKSWDLRFKKAPLARYYYVALLLLAAGQVESHDESRALESAKQGIRGQETRGQVACTWLPPLAPQEAGCDDGSLLFLIAGGARSHPVSPPLWWPFLLLSKSDRRMIKDWDR